MATPTSTLVTARLTKVFREVVEQTPAVITTAPATTFLTTQHVTANGVTNDHVTIPGKTIDIVIPTCVQTIQPDPNEYLPPGTCHAIWNYYPSFPAALAFMILFGVLTWVHVYQAIIYKKKFCWVIIMASSWETMAYVFRAISTRYQQNTGIYLVSQVFVLLSPLWVNAFDYMVLGRMIHFFLPSRKVYNVPASTLAAGFVSLDFVAFVIQLVGGSIAGPTAPTDEKLRAIHIYMGGIGLQQCFIVVFVAFAAKFHLERRKLDVHKGAYTKRKSGWFPLLLTLYASLIFITIRIVFRLVEFSSGSTGTSNPLVTDEMYFYMLEAMPMLLAILAFNFVHPGAVFVGPESEMPGFIKTCLGLFRKRSQFRELHESSDSEEMSITRA